MQVVGGGEASRAADVEQRGDTGKAVGVKAHLHRRETDELRVGERVSRLERCRGELGVVERKQVDRSRVARRAVTARAAIGVSVGKGRGGQVVDGAHDKRIGLDRHALVNGVVEHGQESVKLVDTRKAFLDLFLRERQVNLERGLAVEELSRHSWLIEHVGVIARAVRQLPRLVFHRFRQVGCNLFDHSAVLERIHEDRRYRTAIGAVNENHLADTVNQLGNVVVYCVSLKDRLAHINKVSEVLGNYGAFAQYLGGGAIYQLVNLLNVHCFTFLVN